jgi:hypothetical protein
VFENQLKGLFSDKLSLMWLTPKAKRVWALSFGADCAVFLADLFPSGTLVVRGKIAESVARVMADVAHEFYPATKLLPVWPSVPQNWMFSSLWLRLSEMPAEFLRSICTLGADSWLKQLAGVHVKSVMGSLAQSKSCSLSSRMSFATYKKFRWLAIVFLAESCHHRIVYKTYIGS